MPFRIADIVKQSNRRENVYGPGFFFVADCFDVSNAIDEFQQPGVEPSTDEFRRYIITDPYNLHASYGTIDNVGTGDIVQAISDEERPVKSFIFEVVMSAANTGDLVNYSNGQIGSRVFNVGDLSSYIFNGSTWENVQVGPEGSSSSAAGNTYYGGTGLTLTDFVTNVGQTFSIDSSSVLYVAGISLDGAITFADGFTQSHAAFNKILVGTSSSPILGSDYYNGGYSTLILSDSDSVNFIKNTSAGIPFIQSNAKVDDSTIEISASNGLQVKDLGIGNAKLENSSITINAGSGVLISGSSVSLGGSCTIDVNADNDTLVTSGDTILVKDNGITDAKIKNTETFNFAGLVTSGGITTGGPVNLQDNDLIRPNLKDYSEEVSTKNNISSVASISFTDGNVQTATVTGTVSIQFIDPPSSGKAGTITLILTNGGSATITWDTDVVWPGGVTPTLSSSGTDVLSFLTTDGGSTIYGFVGGLNFS